MSEHVPQVGLGRVLVADTIATTALGAAFWPLIAARLGGLGWQWEVACAVSSLIAIFCLAVLVEWRVPRWLAWLRETYRLAGDTSEFALESRKRSWSERVATGVMLPVPIFSLTLLPVLLLNPESLVLSRFDPIERGMILASGVLLWMLCMAFACRLTVFAAVRLVKRRRSKSKM